METLDAEEEMRAQSEKRNAQHANDDDDGNGWGCGLESDGGKGGDAVARGEGVENNSNNSSGGGGGGEEERMESTTKSTIYESVKNGDDDEGVMIGRGGEENMDCSSDNNIEQQKKLFEFDSQKNKKNEEKSNDDEDDWKANNNEKNGISSGDGDDVVGSLSSNGDSSLSISISDEIRMSSTIATRSEINNNNNSFRECDVAPAGREEEDSEEVDGREEKQRENECVHDGYDANSQMDDHRLQSSSTRVMNDENNNNNSINIDLINNEDRSVTIVQQRQQQQTSSSSAVAAVETSCDGEENLSISASFPPSTQKRQPKEYWDDLANVERELREAIEKMGDKIKPGTMPKCSELQTHRFCGLKHAIYKHGGFEAVAERLGLAVSTASKPLIYWDDFANVEKELGEAIEKMGDKIEPGTMPNRRELDAQRHHALRKAIYKHGGFPAVAERLGLTIPKKGNINNSNKRKNRDATNFKSNNSDNSRLLSQRHQPAADDDDDDDDSASSSSLEENGADCDDDPSDDAWLPSTRSSNGKQPHLHPNVNAKLQNEIRQAITAMGDKIKPGTIPRRSDLDAQGHHNLRFAIYKHGGFCSVAERMGLKMPENSGSNTKYVDVIGNEENQEWVNVQSMANSEQSARRPFGYWKDIANVEKEICKVIEKMGDKIEPGRMPRRSELRDGSLIIAIGNHGGFEAVAERLGLGVCKPVSSSTRRPNGYWNDFANLEKELRVAIVAMGDKIQPGTMPSRKDLQEQGYYSLTDSIYLHGGFEAVAERLGLAFSTASSKPETHWNDFANVEQEVPRAIGRVEDKLMVGTRSTNKDLQGNVLCNHGGFAALAEQMRLNMPHKSTNNSSFNDHVDEISNKENRGWVNARSTANSGKGAYKPSGYWNDFENMETELRQAIEKMGDKIEPGTIPSRSELESQGFCRLARAIYLHGGYQAVRERLKLVSSSSRTLSTANPLGYWNDFANVEKEIRQAITMMGIESGRMPTPKEIYAHSHDLANAIYHHGGFKAVAKRMDLACVPPSASRSMECSNLVVIRENGERMGDERGCETMPEHGQWMEGLDEREEELWREMNLNKGNLTSSPHQVAPITRMINEDDSDNGGGDEVERLEREIDYVDDDCIFSSEMDDPYLLSRRVMNDGNNSSNMNIDCSSNDEDHSTTTPLLQQQSTSPLSSSPAALGSGCAVSSSSSRSLKMRPSGYWNDFRNVEKELRQAIEKMGDKIEPGTMPTYKAIERQGNFGLTGAMRRHGGNAVIAKKLGLAVSSSRPPIPPRPSGYWQDFANVEKELRQAIDKMGDEIEPGTMPSWKDLEARGNRGVARAIYLHGGYEAVAERLGLIVSRTKSDVDSSISSCRDENSARSRDDPISRSISEREESRKVHEYSEHGCVEMIPNDVPSLPTVASESNNSSINNMKKRKEQEASYPAHLQPASSSVFDRIDTSSGQLTIDAAKSNYITKRSKRQRSGEKMQRMIFSILYNDADGWDLSDDDSNVVKSRNMQKQSTTAKKKRRNSSIDNESEMEEREQQQSSVKPDSSNNERRSSSSSTDNHVSILHSADQPHISEKKAASELETPILKRRRCEDDEEITPSILFPDEQEMQGSSVCCHSLSEMDEEKNNRNNNNSDKISNDDVVSSSLPRSFDDAIADLQ